MALECQIKASESITRQGIGAALQDHSTGLKDGHDFFQDGLEQFFKIRLIGNTITQWSIDGKSDPILGPDITNVTSAREKVSIFVQGKCHDSIGRES
jgi:hypothetical protein